MEGCIKMNKIDERMTNMPIHQSKPSWKGRQLRYCWTIYYVPIICVNEKYRCKYNSYN